MLRNFLGTFADVGAFGYRIENVGPEVVPRYLPTRCLLDIARRFGWDALIAIEPIPDVGLGSADEPSEGALTTGYLDGGEESVVHTTPIPLPLLKRNTRNLAPLQPRISYASWQRGGDWIVRLSPAQAKVFGKTVETYRLQLRMTQGDLAKMVNTAQQNIDKIEKGKTLNSSFSPSICVALAIPRDELPQPLRDLVLSSSLPKNMLHSSVTNIQSVADKMTDKDWLVLEGLMHKYDKVGGAHLLIRAILEIEARMLSEVKSPPR